MSVSRLFTRNGLIFTLALFAPLLYAGSPGYARAEVLTLEAAVQHAEKENPGLGQMRARAQAMATIPSQAGALPDPMLSLNAMNLPTDTYDTSQEAMTQMQIGFSQAFPFPGKRRLRATAAEHEALAAAAQVEETRLRLIRDVKQGWWALFYLDRALEIVNRNQMLLRQFVDIAQTKYKVGQGLQQDVLLAQVELSKLFDKEIRIKSKRRTREVRLNELLNRPTDMEIRLPQKTGMDLPRVAPETALHQLADTARPLLAVRQNQIDAGQNRLKLAKKDYMPNFKLGAAYGFRKGRNPNGSERADFASVMFSMSLPLYAGRKQSKAVDQRASELSRQKLALQDSRERIQSEISRALADYQQAREQVELFETGIIPQARQTVASMLAGYQVNKVDFLNLVRAQVTLYNFETQYWKALSEANQALAGLAAAVGEEKVYE